MAVHSISAPKSIPVSKAVATVLSLSDHGTTGSVTGQGSTVTDMQAVDDYHEGLLYLEVLTKNGQGGTPTSPGAAATFTIYYAFCDYHLVDDLGLLVSDAPNVLGGIDDSFTVTLPDTNSTGADGTRVHRSGDPFVFKGRYLYVWYDRDAFAANALVDLTAKVVRV